MTSTIRLPENNGLETCHSMLVFLHILGRKDIKLEVQNFVLMIRTKTLAENNNFEYFKICSSFGS